MAWNSVKLSPDDHQTILIVEPCMLSMFRLVRSFCSRSLITVSRVGHLGLKYSRNSPAIVLQPVHTHSNFWNTWIQIHPHTHSWSINTQREPLRLSGTASTKYSEQCCDSSSYRYPGACEWAASEEWGLWVIWLAAVYLWGWGEGRQAHRVVWGRQDGGQEQDPGTLGKLVCWGWQLQMTLSDVTPVGCRCLRTQETALRAVSLTLSPVPLPSPGGQT